MTRPRMRPKDESTLIEFSMDGAAGRHGTEVKEIIYYGRQAMDTGSADGADVQAYILHVEKW